MCSYIPMGNRQYIIRVEKDRLTDIYRISFDRNYLSMKDRIGAGKRWLVVSLTCTD